MDYLTQILDSIISNFDFTYCLIVNLLTYFTIKIIDEINKDNKVKTWTKRIVLLIFILLTGVVYYIIGKDISILINSAVLAPVTWSWIFKPICKKLGIDYKQVDDTISK